MSITLRSTSDTTTSQTYGYASKATPLTSEEVDKNFITLKQKCDELGTDYVTTFNTDGSLKDGAVTSVSIADNSVTATKIKDRSVNWAEQRNIIYVTDISTTVNKVEGTIDNYLSDSGLTELASGTLIYFKALNSNTGDVTLTVKDQNTTTEKTTTLVSSGLLKQKDAAMSSDDIQAGGIYAAFWDGSSLQLVNTLQDPTVEVKESISRVQTFGPIEFPVSELESDGTYNDKSHELGVAPTTYTAMLHCDGGDTGIGYNAGDIVPLSLAVDGSKEPAFSVVATVSQIRVSRSSESSGSVFLPKAGTEGTSGITEANWKVVVRGTLQNDSTYSPAYVDRALSYPAMYPTSGITVGHYLYLFSAPTGSSKGAFNTLTKTNLITNRVTLVAGDVGGFALGSLTKYADDNKYRATGATIHDGGSGFVVNEVITIPGGSGTAAKFVVKTVNSNSSPANAVASLYELSDTADDNSDATGGEYTSTPDNPISIPDGNTSESGTGLELDVSYRRGAEARLYWTDRNKKLRYIVPNGLDAAEAFKTETATASNIYQLAIVESNVHYGFIQNLGKTDDKSSLTNLSLYKISEAASVQGDARNLSTLSPAMFALEGNTNKALECVQWNPVKRRLYIAARGTNLMHIWEWDIDGESSLNALFSGSPDPTYKKTIGIPGQAASPIGGDSDYLNQINVDWDVDTGEEKSITITKYGYNGSVTRAAWKED